MALGLPGRGPGFLRRAHHGIRDMLCRSSPREPVSSCTRHLVEPVRTKSAERLAEADTCDTRSAERCRVMTPGGYRETVLLKLGGALIVPAEGIATEYLRQFHES